MGRRPLKISLAPVLAVLLLLLAAGPVVLLVGQAVWGTHPPSAEVYGRGWLTLLGRSVGIAGAVATLTTALGLGVGFSFSKVGMPGKSGLRLLTAIPLLLAPYLLAVAWSDGFYQFGWDRRLLFGPVGVVLVLTTVYTPLATYFVVGSLANMNASLEEAGLLMTTYPGVFRRLVLPLLRPALGSSFGLIFVLALSEFSVPSYLGVTTLVTEIFTQFAAFYRSDVAIGQSVVLIGLCLLLLLPQQSFLTRAPLVTMGSRSFRSLTFTKPWQRGWAFGLVTLYGVGFIGLPLSMLVRQALSRGGADLRDAFARLLPALLPSLGLAAGGALLLTATAWLLARAKVPGQYGLLLALFAVPSTVLGIAYSQFYNTVGLSSIYQSPLIIVLAYWGRFLFIPVRLLAGALAQLSPGAEEAALLVGANAWVRFRRVLAPLLADVFIIAFGLCFVLCLGELATMILVYPPGTQVLSVSVFTYMANAPQSLVSALTLVVLGITCVCLMGMVFVYTFFVRSTWRQSPVLG